MPDSKEERMSDDEVQTLRASTDALQTAQDAAQDAHIKHERLQRRFAVKYELRGRETIDPFGFIIREKRG